MFSFLLSFVLLGIAKAEPLGTFPQVDTRAQRIIVESQSDLWTRPYAEKDDPFRRYDVSFKSPVIKQPKWNAGVSLETDGVRFGRPDLVIISMLSSTPSIAIRLGDSKRRRSTGNP